MGLNGGGVLAWYATSIEDRFGNTITIEYETETDPSSTRPTPDITPTPKKITYGGNVSVDFNYTNWNGYPTYRGGGWVQRHTRKLDDITVKIDDNLIRKYSTVYEEGLLARVQECGYPETGSESNAECKRPLSFDWAEVPEGFESSSQVFTRTRGGSGGELFAAMTVDWNGDQISDLLNVSYNGAVSIRYGSSSGLGSESSLLFSAYDPRDWSSENGAFEATVRSGFVPVDINLDGLTDLVFAESEFRQSDLDSRTSCVWMNGDNLKNQCFRDHWPSAKVTWKVLISRGEQQYPREQVLHSRLDDNEIFMYPTHESISQYFLSFFLEASTFPIVMDAEGDSIPELMFPVVKDIDEVEWEIFSITSFPGSDTVSLQPSHSTGVSATDYAGAFSIDADGDGNSEAMFRNAEGWFLYHGPENNDYWSEIPFLAGDAVRPIALDANGDGLKDLFVQRRTSAQLYLNVGLGFDSHASDFWEGASSESSLRADYVGGDGIVARDFNGDGKDDLFVPPLDSDDEWRIAYSYGDGFTYAEPSGIPYTLGNSLRSTDYLGLADSIISIIGSRFDWMVFGDVNGDGVIDAVQTDYENNKWNVYPSKRKSPLHVERFVDSFLNESVVEYLPATDDTVYTPGEASSYPDRTIRGGLSLVRSVTSSNGIGGQNTTSYKYHHGKLHLRGLGFLGFESVDSFDEQRGTKTTTERILSSAQYWMNGRVEYTRTVRQSDDALLSEQYLGWHRYFPTYQTNASRMYAKATVDYELDGKVRSVTQVENEQFDSTSGLFRKTVTKTGLGEARSGGYVTFDKLLHQRDYEIEEITNSEDDWLLGFKNRVVETNTVYDQSGAETDSKSKTTTYVQQPGTLRAKEVTRYVGLSELEYKTTYAFDAYGNVQSTTLGGNPAGNFDQRTTTVLEFQDNRYPKVVQNALGQTKTLEYDKRFGSVVNATDIDSLQTSQRYDAQGRMVRSVAKDGTITQVKYEFCLGCAPAWLDVQPAYKVVTRTLSPMGGKDIAPQTTSYVDSMGREVLSETTGFDGQPIYRHKIYDSVGRLVEESSPAKGQPTHYTKHTSIDVFDRVLTTELPTEFGAGSGGVPNITREYTGSDNGGVVKKVT